MGKSIKFEKNKAQRGLILINALFIVFVAGAVFFATWRTSENSFVTQTRTMSEQIRRNVVNRMQAYFAPVQNESLLSGIVIRDFCPDPFGKRADMDEVFEYYGALLGAMPQLQMVYFADGKGRLFMLRRMPDGSYSKRFVENDGRKIRIRYEHRNPAWAADFPDSEEDAATGYDPRKRGWYQSAAAAGKLVWTPVYLFSTGNVPGFTCAVPVKGKDGRFLGVNSLDITTAELSRFLGTIQPTPRTRIVVFDDDGKVIALQTSDAEDMKRLFMEAADGGGGTAPALRTVEDFADSNLGVFVRGGLATPDKMVLLDVGGEKYASVVSPVHVGDSLQLNILVVIPEADIIGGFHKNMFVTTSICIVLLVGILAISSIRLTANMARMLASATAAADAASEAKSRFLTQINHEMRTPMNAIIGMSELALREKLPPALAGYLVEIRQAGDGLMRLINDVLDFSKIESGKMEIVPVDYELGSVLNDVISIVRSRLSEKSILFTTRISPRLPALLHGDETRVRQVLLNLLGNAAKYTAEGEVRFSVRCLGSKTGPGEPMTLAFEVGDTGIGIKKEDMDRLFGEFVQFDALKNKGVEGTGLGLAITRELCRLMGGDVSVKSEYGKGSVFTATVVQGVGAYRPLASVPNAGEKRVLAFMGSEGVGDMLEWALAQFGVACARVRDEAALERALEAGGYGFVFTSGEAYPACVAAAKKQPAPPVVVLALEYGEMPRDEAHTIELPIQPASLANILNGGAARKSYGARKNLRIRFTAPGARVLVVDDVTMNLNVARGLLSPYGMKVELASSGRQSVDMVAANRYDIVFMDHMMPGMDGIEALAAIRALDVPWAKDVPVVALTANAVSEMRQMLLERGFADYISKPIDVNKLDEVVSKLVPAPLKKRVGSDDGAAASNPRQSV